MQLLLYIPGIRDNAPCTSFQALRETPASLLKFVFKILGKLFILEYINKASCNNDEYSGVHPQFSEIAEGR